MTDGEPDEAWWRAHFEESGWQVKWGFDSGDCFTVFPLLPKIFDEMERWVFEEKVGVFESMFSDVGECQSIMSG